MSGIKINTIDHVYFSSNEDINVISVDSITETFLDVFECKLDDKIFIFEKVGEENEYPLVICNILKDGKEFVTEAILKVDSNTGIYLNESSLHPVVSQQDDTPIQTIKENNISGETVEDSNKGDTVVNVIAESLTSYNTQKINEKINEKLKKYNSIYENRIKEFEDKKKEFLNIIDGEFENKIKNFNEEMDGKLQNFFTLNETENKYNMFNETEKLRETVLGIHDDFKSEIERRIKQSSKKDVKRSIDNKGKELYEKISNNTDKLIEQNKQLLTDNFNNLSNEFAKELNELKTLKRDTNITSSKAINEQNKKIKSVLEHVNSKFNELNKEVKLISEAKNAEYNELLAAVNNKEVVEYKTILKEKFEAAELNAVKTELREELNSNIQHEARGLRRIADMYSGGGSNAVQYANGGTMNGNLNVNGELKADTILATTLLSATTMDINFELSGFSITGDLSASGNISSSSLTTSALSTEQNTDLNIKSGPGGSLDIRASQGASGGGDIAILGKSFNLQTDTLTLNDNGLTSTTGSNAAINLSNQSDSIVTLNVNSNTHDIDMGGKLTVSELIGEQFTSTDDISARDIIKSGRLNVGSGNLFVDDGTSTGNAFVKMGAYGAGNFFGKEGSVNGATFSLGVGSAGKIVEDMRIDTFALSGAGLVNKYSNPVVLVTSPGANRYIVPVSIQVYKSQSSVGGDTRIPWPAGTGATAFGIGTFANSGNTGNFRSLTALPRNTAIINGDWMYNRNQGPDTTTQISSNRDLCLRGFSDMSSNTSTDVIYLKVRYMIMSEDGDFKSIANLQIKDS